MQYVIGTLIFSFVAFIVDCIRHFLKIRKLNKQIAANCDEIERLGLPETANVIRRRNKIKIRK